MEVRSEKETNTLLAETKEQSSWIYKKPEKSFSSQSKESLKWRKEVKKVTDWATRSASRERKVDGSVGCLK